MAVPLVVRNREARRRPARPIALNSDLGGNWENRVVLRCIGKRLEGLARRGTAPADFAGDERQFLPVCGRLCIVFPVSSSGGFAECAGSWGIAVEPQFVGQ